MNNRERSHTDLQSNSLLRTEPQNEGEPNRSSNQDPKLLIKASYECIKKILDLDTQSTIADINLLETINNSSTLKYRDVESYVNTILEDSETVKQKGKH
ncbi:DEKNAAC104476 [Brettanomyces naardenensis]|uniref:DEKNAAC104476 n=1 Tax=Brettanomyces naardenensis TaxID=13370 RepID=A0A448YR12_BRENA|nr:DEKNAAC104476 [Brettanomyces naardenensis]